MDDLKELAAQYASNMAEAAKYAALAERYDASQTRTRYTAIYSYPGSFFPETTTRDVTDGTYAAAVAAQTDDLWYAVEVKKITERRYEAANGNVEWLKDKSPERVGSWVVGERIHWEDIPDTDDNRILRSNIRGNSTDGYGVKTRRGNWQMASDFSAVVPA